MKIAVERLMKVTSAFLQHLGATENEARLVAENLIKAELRGVTTHGINFLPLLAKRVQEKLVEIPTKLTVISDNEAVAHIDGGNGLGQVAAAEGMKVSIAKARSYGVGYTLLRNSNHIGLLAYYSLMAAAEGMIGFCMCNSAASMAPWGGAEPFFGTNPFSLAAPGGAELPVVLDMSTSVVARGKIRQAVRMKENIPLGWALDKSGVPTDDPGEAMEGTLLPIGGPKGYGMAFFIDIICGLLSGSSFSRDVSTFHRPLSPTGVGIMTMAIDIERFMPIENFRLLIDGHIRAIRDSAKADGQSRIYLPGEIEAENEKEIQKNGVDISPQVFDSVECLLNEAGFSLLSDGDSPAC